jgi:hypothetical protein
MATGTGIPLIDNLLYGIANFVAGLFNQVANWMQGLIVKIVEWTTSIVAYIANYLKSLFDALTAWVNQFAAAITKFLNDLVAPIVAGFELAWSKTVGAIQALITKVGQWIVDLSTNIRILLDNAIIGINNFIAKAIGYIKDIATDIIKDVSDFVSDLAGQIKTTVLGVVTTISNFVGDIKNRLLAGIDVLIGGASALIAGIGEKLGDVTAGFEDVAVKIIAELGRLSDEQIGPIRELVKEYIGPWTDALGPVAGAQLQKSWLDWTSGHSMALLSRADAQAFWQSNIPADKIGRYVFILLSTILSFVATYHGVAQANSDVILQEFSAVFPHVLLPPADVAAAWRKGRIRTEAALSVLRRHGYSDEDAQHIISITESFPGPADLISMAHRSIVSKEDARKALTAQGYDEPWAGRMMTLGEALPPLQDIITMAVREVFSPATRQAFGQDEDFPDRFGTEATRQGLSDQWARDYWAAHWALPSLEQGFEMVHRGAITPALLDALIKANDVMPVWREPLKKITYLPFTRVDIRRMHKVGILDRAAVVEAHLELGYSPGRAEQLTDFTIALNKGPGVADDEELGTLTRTTVLGFFKDGLITEARALELLVEIGLSKDAAALYVANTKLEIQRQTRKDAIDLVLDQYSALAISYEDAQAKLVALQLSPTEVQKAILGLQQIKRRGTKVPTRAEAEAMVKAGVMTLAEYAEFMGRLGYAPIWAQRFAAMLGAKNG